ncbi:MAG: aminodeoxychorismate/anthranilate synthase component II [Acidobacteria bacterium]|jgi:anthranilate synthase component II|nr:aminodeoxychorismate/anthranilate synthase component II [Acidobacteriota bacterium]
MILLLDNYDSFTWNLAHGLGELGAEVQVVRNDKVTVEEIAAQRPSHLVISPGPGRPENAGVSIEAIRRFAGMMPVLGVCLGHQAISIAFGGRVERAGVPMHGKTSPVEHDGRGVFAGLAHPCEAGRYHSLVVPRDGVPADFEVSAWVAGADETVMGLRHVNWPVTGLQFHPESVLTPAGHQLLRNFLEQR